MKIGDPAQGFTLRNQAGEGIIFKPGNGKWTVIYFYPRALTPGCTRQACGVQQEGPAFQKWGVEFLGISTDAPAKLAKFATEYGLTFNLLSDPDHRVADLYGAWQTRTLYGKQSTGVARMTFVVDPEGRIAHIIPKVKPDTHAADLLAWFEKKAA